MGKRIDRPGPQGASSGRATKRQRGEPMQIKRKVVFGEDKIITTVTSSGFFVDVWLFRIRRMYRRFLNKLIVGLDVEWRPNFTRGGKQNPVALLQLCVGRRCLIFQLLRADFIPDSLAEFLADRNFRFVGVGVQGDADLLNNNRRRSLPVASTVDLRDLAAERMCKPALRQAGLQALVRAVMGGPELQKPKSVRMGPWDAYDLSEQQIRYACIDAFVSSEIGRKLLD